MQEHIEAAVAQARFNGSSLLRVLAPLIRTDVDSVDSLRIIGNVLTPRQDSALLSALARSAFLIELVKLPKIESTKFETRWGGRLDAEDPRYTPFMDSVTVFQHSLRTLSGALVDPTNCALLIRFLENGLLPYEIPLDYIERRAAAIHRAPNIEWLWDSRTHKAILLRKFLLSLDDAIHRRVFETAYKSKIQIKTYLTDRVLTGQYKTNREKRWEAHPSSVHFARRRECLDVERELVDQLCHFDGFPQHLFDQLVERDLIDASTEVYRCPVTLDPLSFEDFRAELLNPQHGRSMFQVGHLNPLKAVNDDPSFGHTAANIGWISSDGNRIQGSLTLTETRQLIQRVSSNYDLASV